MKWGRTASRKLLSYFPKTPRGDFLRSVTYFYVAHRRIPSKTSRLYNDYLFFLKNSPEIDDALRQITSDKIYMKAFISSLVGSEYTTETLAVVDSPDDFEEKSLPSSCVIKPAHLSGIVVYYDKSNGGISEESFYKLRQSFSRNLYSERRERNYRNLRPRLMCEEVLLGPSEIKDYKVFCFNGKPRIIQVDSDRHSCHRRVLYDTRWQPISITYNKPLGDLEPPPRQLEEMLGISQRIAQNFSSVRVDCFITPERIVVGELTHCPEQGHGRFGSVKEERIFSEIYFR